MPCVRVGYRPATGKPSSRSRRIDALIELHKPSSSGLGCPSRSHDHVWIASEVEQVAPLKSSFKSSDLS